MRKVVFAVRVVMVSINPKKAHSHASCAVLVKQHGQLKQHPMMNVVMNVQTANSWEAMVTVNHVHVDRIDHRAFNPHVHHVRWVEPLRRLVHLQLKSAHYRYASPAHISMAP